MITTTSSETMVLTMSHLPLPPLNKLAVDPGLPALIENDQVLVDVCS